MSWNTISHSFMWNWWCWWCCLHLTIWLLGKPLGLKCELLVKWYDLWVGVYWDRKNRRLYIFWVPMVGMVIWRGQEKTERMCTAGEFRRTIEENEKLRSQFAELKKEFDEWRIMKEEWKKTACELGKVYRAEKEILDWLEKQQCWRGVLTKNLRSEVKVDMSKEGQIEGR